MTTTTTTKNLKDIKLLIGVSDSISSNNLLITIIDNLKSSLSSIAPNSRLRLHPYFVLSTVGGSKESKALTVNDVKTLEVLQPLLIDLHNGVKDKIADHSLPPLEGRSILKTVLSFVETMQKKMDNLSDASAPVVYDYNLIIDETCVSLEKSNSWIIMPAFDAKPLNIKRLPSDIMVDQPFFSVVYINISAEDLALSFSVKKQNIEKEKVKPNSAKSSKTPKSQKNKKGLVNLPTSASWAVSTPSMGEVSNDVKDRIEAGLQ